VADQYRARGIPQDWVLLEHPQVEGSQTVHPRAVAHWEARGWKVASQKKQAAAASPAAQKES
jgi:hypothetical protein